MTGEVDWIALESLFLAQEDEDDEAEESYSEQEERLCWQFARGLCALARAKREEGDYAAAEPLSRQALEILEKEFGEDHPTVGEASYCHALVLREGERWRDAEPWFRRAIAIYEKRLEPNDLRIAWASFHLAILLRKKCDYTAAEPLSRRTLAIFENNNENHSRPDDVKVALTLFNLAVTLEAMRDYAAAEQSIRRALSIDQTELAKIPDQWTQLKAALVRCVDANAELLRARSLEEEASALARMRDYEAAQTPYRRALEIRETWLGPEHPDVAESLHDLANMLKAKGNYDAAVPLYRRALAINEKHLGSGHPRVMWLKGTVARLGGG